MSEATHQRDWEDLSRLDPLWAIASEPPKRFGQWDADEFLASGNDIVEPIMAQLDNLSRPASRKAALDFGCGAGRLTRALSPHFSECVGIDVAAKMVDLARELNCDKPNCRFERRTDLRGIADASFDLVLSFLVLQHLPGARAIGRTLDELVRVLRPGGVLVFQVPTRLARRHRLQPRRRLYRALRGLRVSPEVLYHALKLQPIRMTALGDEKIRSRLCDGAAQVLAVDSVPGPGGLISSTYWVTR